MKLTTLFSIALSLNVWASVYSQNTRFTLDLNGKTVREVFQLIEEQSQFRFFYNDDFSYIDNVVSMDVKNENVEEILEKLFETSDITYKVFNDNLVVLTPKAGLQQVNLKGVITDQATGDPLPGANVQIKGTTRGVVADLNGRYSIEVNTGDVLVFSFIGYLPEEVPFQGQAELSLALTPDVQSLDEVVVIGYGTAKKSDITGSVVTVSTEDMMKKAPTNILQGLKGMAAGVVVTAQDGAPDANSAVYIRGIATINGTSKPLYVVDGVPVGDNANFLNPSDIERIEVLKD
ncbi:MAG: carboxypeptidase-like regulatory domain-containing protein, partial [Bacteroidales bacterium]|nr:carboxypeptidase-like regulatory domain-containing protein [Bacteroidales bacterium]